MRKRIAFILVGTCLLALAGCGKSLSSGAVGPSRPVAAYISDQVTQIEMTHILAGQMETRVAEGDDVDALRAWTAGLKYRHVEFAEGESPAEGEGAEVYSFHLTEGEYPVFAYYCGDKDHSYLCIEGEWYKVSNPSHPPVQNTPEHDLPIESIPKEPPELIIVDGRSGKKTAALKGTCSWMYPDGDGTSSGIAVDSASALNSRQYMPALDANGAAVELTFAIPADEVTVRCWGVECWGDNSAEADSVTVTDGRIELEQTSHIYEVCAAWNSSGEWGGRAWYSFYSGPAAELGTDMGITLSVKEITGNTLTLSCTQLGGNPTGQLQTGAPFWLESYVNGAWEATPRDQIEGAFTMEAWSVPMNDTVEWNIDLGWLYSNLGPGKYRIGKEIVDFRGAGDYDDYTCYAEFEI